MSPLEGPISGGAHEDAAFGPRHWNPFLVAAISLFALAGLYLALVVGTRLDRNLFPGNQLSIPISVPGVDSGGNPSVTTIDDRINILVMGLDLRRDEPDDQPARTDSIFVFTIDPYTKTGGIFSIPRDLAVDIPDGYGGYVSDRINTAYERGEMRQKGSGPDLAIATVEHNFDIPIDYYAVLNFNNFIEIIDELGGIDVNVPEYVYDPAYNDCNACYYRSVEFLPGPQHMDGETALAYSRLRHSDNDFKRIERQQLVMRAVARRASGLDWLLSGKAISLYNQYKSTVKTNVKDARIPGLALLAKQVGVDNIRMESLAEATYPCPYSICGGGALLLAYPDKVAEIKARVFGDGHLQQENPVVKIINGTSTPKLGDQLATYLKAQGISSANITVDEYANGALFNTTAVFDMKGKKYTRGKLSEWLSLPDARIQAPADATAEQQPQLNDPAADFVVILGADADVPKLTYADSSTYDSSGSDSSSDSSSDSGTSPRRTYAPEPADSAPVITPTPEPAATDTPEPVPSATADPEPTATPLLDPPLPVDTPQARGQGH